MTKVIISLFLLWTITLSYFAFNWLTTDLALKAQTIKTEHLNESFEEYLRTYGKINSAFKCVTREIE